VPELALALLVAATAGLSGAGAQRLAERRDLRAHPAPGRFVDVGDARLHAVVSGHGPVVLVDSGLGGSSLEWAEVADELDEDATVVRYDRPGFGWSPGSRCDRRALAAAQRLLALLDAVSPDRPAVLVGHSLGGVHVRLAAALAPQRVAGLVLVDPSHEDMLPVVEGSSAAAVMRAALRVLAGTAPWGAGRVAGRALARLALAEVRQPLSVEQRASARLSGLLTCRTVRGIRALSAEQQALAASLHQLVATTADNPEPDLPLTVITAAAPSPNAKVADARRQVDAMHAALVASHPGAQHVLAEDSGHLVPFDAPDVVSRCVRELVARLALAPSPEATA
jgi:pimeloyl-ACP methyl ester carboxylesterase